ncbi:LuxR C-terminal-related transcriptional regulator [Brooklawnia cerclae]|uniref:DNA-binding CsgD family transcriptional regulator n=1 Tax=Brooklawnia cerclae TaxID=349934 RepID=A0ABX0SDV3_9ACTN|nr:DNA-binding CsgD family transcriptional regulator [Brooklawnia cerclae]
MAAVLESILPYGPTAPRWAVDKVFGAALGGDGRTGAKATPEFRAALSWSLLRAGRFDDALKLSEGRGLTVLSQAAGEVPDTMQSVCYSVTAETFLLNGRLSDAAATARIAADYATESQPHRFRALSLLAATLALSGEVAPAAGAIGSAWELDGGRGWVGASWPLVLATTQIGFWQSDADGIQEALDTFSRVADPDAVERAVANTAVLGLHMVREDYHSAVATAATLTKSVDAKLCPPLLANGAISSEALALVHLGDPGAALKALGHRVSPPAHTTCFELLRAGIHLQLGEPRKALAVTEVCVRNTPDHSPLSLPSVLLRRAIAHEVLGHHSLADADFSRSAHLSAEFAGIRAAIGLPLDVIETLYWRLAANEPEFRPKLTQELPPQDVYPDREPLGFDLPDHLTERERVLAGWLTTDMTIQAIAEQLCVSTNTVKTQTKSLYRKLGVSSRREAIERLEATGIVRTNPSAN